jgi:hypothetical protein
VPDDRFRQALAGLALKTAIPCGVTRCLGRHASIRAEIYSIDFSGEKGKPAVAKCTDLSGTKEHTLQIESSLTKKLETASEEILSGAMTFEEEMELTDT